MTNVTDDVTMTYSGYRVGGCPGSIPGWITSKKVYFLYMCYISYILYIVTAGEEDEENEDEEENENGIFQSLFIC